jgi:cysteine synthase A
MNRIFADATGTIGATPLVRLDPISKGLQATLLGKLELKNPLGSVKHRIACLVRGQSRPS